jgi:Holliday junction resolvasome RuvABC DNA-binding subunit
LGKLFVESTPAGLRFFHADGTPYGSSLCLATNEAGAKAETGLSRATAEARAKAESALKSMGFSAKEVRLALARIPKDSDASLEQIIRQGLAELAP